MFAIGSACLALASTCVREVLRAVALTPLPGAPEGVDGVIDVRGSLLPVYDMSARVGAPRRPIRAADHLLLCDAGPRGLVAVRADRVLEVRTILGPTDAFGPAAFESTDPMVNGLVRLDDGVVVLCDLGAFLSATNAAMLARAIAALQEAASAQ